MALLVAIWREWVREAELADERVPAELSGREPARIEVLGGDAPRKSHTG
jgi:hypothetical protein